MRLRSSQIVFLLLLACSVQTQSVQIEREHVERWIAQSLTGSTPRSTPLYQVSAGRRQQSTIAGVFVSRRVRSLPLDPAALASQSAPWPMYPPASNATSVASYTGLRRL